MELKKKGKYCRRGKRVGMGMEVEWRTSNDWSLPNYVLRGSVVRWQLVEEGLYIFVSWVSKASDISVR